MCIRDRSDSNEGVTGINRQCSSNNTVDMFQCTKDSYNALQTCLTRNSLCNGIPECPNGEDEAVQQCGKLSLFFTIQLSKT